MIDLKSVLNSQHQRITPINRANPASRLVSAITIMDNIAVEQWLRGGEIVLVGSHTLPNDQNKLKELLSQLKINQACCLIIKHVVPFTANQEFLIHFSEKIDLPVFQLATNVTYLELMNDVNTMLFKDRQSVRLAELDLNHLLKTDYPHDSDFDYISSLKNIDLYKQQVCVMQFVLMTQSSPDKRLRDLFALTTQLQSIFEVFIHSELLLSHFILPTSTGANVVLFTNEGINYEDTKARYSQVTSQIRIPDKALYVGLSNLHPAKQLHESYQEAVFSIKIAKIFNQRNQVTSFNTIALWSLINNSLQSKKSELLSQEIQDIFKSAEIFDTLAAYFQNNESIKETSRQLYTHPNTVRYRLKEITTRTGLDYQKTDDKFRLYVAVIIQTLRQGKH